MTHGKQVYGPDNDASQTLLGPLLYSYRTDYTQDGRDLEHRLLPGACMQVSSYTACYVGFSDPCALHIMLMGYDCALQVIVLSLL